jgi:hypothetical protein
MSGLMPNKNQPEENPDSKLEALAAKTMLNSVLISELSKEQEWVQEIGRLSGLAQNLESFGRQIRELIPLQPFTENRDVWNCGVELLHQLRDMRSPQKSPNHCLAHRVIKDFSRRVRISNPMEIHLSAMQKWIHLDNPDLVFVLYAVAVWSGSIWPMDSFAECSVLAFGMDFVSTRRVWKRLKSGHGIGKLVQLTEKNTLYPKAVLRRWVTGSWPIDDAQKAAMLAQIPVRNGENRKESKRVTLSASPSTVESLHLNRRLRISYRT